MEFIFKCVWTLALSKLILRSSVQFHEWMQTRALVWSRSNSIFFFEPGYDINLKNNERHDIKIKPNNCFLRTNCDDAHCAIECVPSLEIHWQAMYVSTYACMRSWSRTRWQNERNVKCCGFEAHAKPRYDGSSNSFYYASIFQMLFFPSTPLTHHLNYLLFQMLSITLSLSLYRYKAKIIV